MGRTILGVVGGVVAWVVIVTVLNIGLRHALPGYTQGEPTMTFTLAMKIARLSEAVITSLLAGAITRWIAPASRFAPWIVGLIMLAMFLPIHIKLWSHLPVWYHLFFLVTLAPLVALGARLLPARQPASPVAA